MLLRRIVLLYIVLLLCRIVFYCYNYALIGPLGWQEVLTLAGGGLKFDTVSVLYANLLFIVLSLLPFHFRERSWYRRILFWYYAVINSLLIVAVNLADCVYFRYTQKRFTSDEIFFTDNSNSAQLVLKFAAENWYLLLVGAVLIDTHDEWIAGDRRYLSEESMANLAETMDTGDQPAIEGGK